MNTKKQRLVSGLEKAINALKTETVYYNWNKPSSCNCGVVAQAMLGLTSAELRIKANPILDKKELSGFLGIKEDEVELTWRNAVKAYCPIVGRPLKEIFTELENAGLSKEDITHLEYLSNDLILRRSGIETVTITEQQIKTGTRKVSRDTFWGRIFEIKDIEDVYKTEKIKTPVPDYYKKPGNLIKYLTAWVSILKEEKSETDVTTETSFDELERRRLNAEAEQNYEMAAIIRDRINSLSLVKATNQ